MKRLLLLLLPTLFLSWCSLVGNNQTQNTWNIEKNAQLEQQVIDVNVQSSWLQQKNNISQEIQKATQYKKLSHCGLTINYPTPTSTVSFPVTISGTIDNNNASTLGCSWTMYEGQAGTAQLYFLENNNWHQINTPFILHVSDWMTLGPVLFSVIINFNNNWIGLSSGTPMKIIFTEENPSGTTPDTLTLPIILQ